jgi:hypothetical protein
VVRSKLGQALLQFAPLTDEEIKAYADKKQGAVKNDADNFRLDFSRPRSHFFNRDAFTIATTSFIATFGKANGDKQGRIPGELLGRRIVLAAIEKHAEYLWAVYAEATSENAVQREYNRRSRIAKHERKRTVSVTQSCLYFY